MQNEILQDFKKDYFLPFTLLCLAIFRRDYFVLGTGPTENKENPF